MSDLPAPVALLGGTFDPVHYGHLRFADDVRRALHLPEVRLVPAGEPPHRGRPAASAADRRAMLERAVAEFPGLAIDGRELERGGRSYTVDTLRDLRREHPDAPLLLLLGADAFRGLPTWHRWREIPDLAHLVVVERPGADLESGLPAELAALWRARHTSDPAVLFARRAGAILRQDIEPVAVSATAIREKLASGATAADACRGLLPPAVLAYIDLHHLYRPEPDAP